MLNIKRFLTLNWTYPYGLREEYLSCCVITMAVMLTRHDFSNVLCPILS